MKSIWNPVKLSLYRGTYRSLRALDLVNKQDTKEIRTATQAWREVIAQETGKLSMIGFHFMSKKLCRVELYSSTDAKTLTC